MLWLCIFEMSGVCLRFDFEPWFWQDRNAFAYGCFFHILSLLLFPRNNGSGFVRCVSVVCCWKWCVLPSSSESSSSWNRARSTFHHYDYYYYDHIEFASFHHIITSWVGLMMSMMFISQHHILILHMQPASEYLISYHHISFTISPFFAFHAQCDDVAVLLLLTNFHQNFYLLPLFWNTFILVYFSSVFKMTMR